ncbi:hypothetical protein AB6A40_007504 [Gnathostoma spinigerum]|uniref:Uncharacterized protein n=1 Tax=Gnathostoma spinigerum TaxID=75299 RepID=A0ABD6ELF0_9BILA
MHATPILRLAAELSESLVQSALRPRIPANMKQLISELIGGVQLHKPGRFVIVEKPYGISCFGYKQQGGGVFPSSRYDEKGVFGDEENEEHRLDEMSTLPNSLTLASAVPFLAEYFREPTLTLCVGLKRYVSGPVVLPSNQVEYKNIVRSLRLSVSSQDRENGLHRALAICVGQPPQSDGLISGYVTLKDIRDHAEYIFVEGKIPKRRARTGKFAVYGEMYYRVLDYKYGCSLLDLSFSKFARHLPRLMLTNLLCPILGDPLYMKRVAVVDSQPVLLPPERAHRSHPNFSGLSLLKERLMIRNASLYRMPLYFHVYKSVFRNFGRSNTGSRVDLVSTAAIPDHVLAMLECLKLSKAAKHHIMQSDVVFDDEEAVRFSGETKF